MKDRRAFMKAVSGLGTLGVWHPGIRLALGPVLSAVSAGAVSAVEVAADALSGYSLMPVPFNKVNLEDRFWKPRLATQATTLVPFALDKVAPAVENLRRTGEFLKGDKVEMLRLARFVSSDLFKVMEGAAYLLVSRRDPALEANMDAIVDIIASAQRPDGYLYEWHIVGVTYEPYATGDRPYSFVAQSHELYCMGHMYEAAIAYYQATGKDKWLKVAEKNAQHVNRVFFVGDPNYHGGKPVNQADGHPEYELALAKLYRATNNRLYLDMAKRFLDIRGVTYIPKGDPAVPKYMGVMAPSVSQQHEPVAKQRKAVGHAVRAAYLYSGMADVGALTGSRDYDDALTSIWQNIVDTKMHITGGLGAVHGIEGFGDDYELPNKDTYNETCAAVANVFFNTRMFLLTRDAQYLDVAEIALFNNALAGTNLEGNRFFYVNPLEADGKHPFNHGAPGRSPWFDVACCPSNLARLIPQVPGLMYAHEGDELFVTLYGGNSTKISLASGEVGVKQVADYPFDGRIELTLSPNKAQRFLLKLRVPTWARTSQFMPGELYDYAGKPVPAQWSVRVNGAKVNAPLEAGFAVVDRVWNAGDKVELTLPMPVRFSTALPQVEADRGRVAVTRGPLVFCAEGVDNGGPVQQFHFEALPAPSAVKTSTFKEGILTNVVKIELPAKKIVGQGEVKSPLTLIPYYAWNNRGDGSMIVWLSTSENADHQPRRSDPS